MYTALAFKDDICIYVAIQGYICMMSQSLHHIECLEWYIWALFIQDNECFNKHCPVNSKIRHANMAIIHAECL